MKLIKRLLHIADAETKVILYAKFLVIGVRGNIQHEFDPVRAFRHLNLVPIDVRIFFGCAGREVFEAASPVQPEAENIHVEMLHKIEIFDDETSVKEAGADLIGPGARNGYP